MDLHVIKLVDLVFKNRFCLGPLTTGFIFEYCLAKMDKLFDYVYENNPLKTMLRYLLMNNGTQFFEIYI